MNPFYRYVLKKFIYNLFVVLLFVLFLYTFFNVIQHTKYLARYNVNIFQVIYFDLLKIPYSLYQVVPIVIILATVITMVILVKSNEMTGFVSIGGRTRNLSYIFVFFGFFISIFTFILGEYISPKAQLARYKYKMEVFEKKKFVDFSKLENIWIRNKDNKIIFIKILDPIANKFIGMREYYLKNEKVIRYREIKSGQQLSNEWQFNDVVVYDLTDIPKMVSNNKLLTEKNEYLTELSKFNIDNPKLLNFREISNLIDVYKSKGLNTNRYEIIYFSKLAHPISIMAIILAILPVCTSFSRQYSYIKIISKSLTLGGAYWICSASLISISKTGVIAPVIANFLPIIVFTAIGFVLIFLKERGF